MQRHKHLSTSLPGTRILALVFVEFVLVALCGLALLATPAQAKRHKAKTAPAPAPAAAAPAPAPPLHVMAESYPPYNFFDAGGLKGPCAEIVFEIQKRLGQPQKVDVQPWTVAYKQLIESVHPGQEPAALFSMSRTKEREPFFHWVGPLVTFNVSLFALKQRGIRIQNQADKAKYRVGGSQNTPAAAILKANRFPHVDLVADPGLNPKRLKSGQIDLWISGELAAYFKAQEVGVDPRELEPVYDLGQETLYIAFSRSTDKAVVATWQATLDAIRADGVYQAIINKYLPVALPR